MIAARHDHFRHRPPGGRRLLDAVPGKAGDKMQVQLQLIILLKLIRIMTITLLWMLITEEKMYITWV